MKKIISFIMILVPLFILCSCGNKEKIDYDMSGISFNDMTVDYDGQVHSIKINGDLPKGVTVSYLNNDKIEVGIYNVIAKFKGDDFHNEINDMRATLTISAVELKSYTVIWKNADGTVLETDTNVQQGTIPTYDGETPVKASTAETTYTFDGWTTTIVEVTGDTEYVAKYTESPKKYTVTWKNEDGTVLETDTNVEYGTKPTYDGETPVKASTAETTYTFDGWEITTDVVTGNIEYIAKYTETTRTYTVTWKNEDGTVLETDTNVEYGTKPTYGGETPVKSSTVDKTYTFVGWTTTIVEVTGDTEYVAKYTESPKKYTVTWKNEDGTVLETDTNVEYGTKPTYDGGTPIKAPTVDKTYTFAGWTTTIVEVAGDTEYIAKYTETTRTYTVTWKNEDGTVLETDLNVEFGTMATYDGETPVKESTLEKRYAFIGWTPAFYIVTGDIEYVAEYIEITRTYTVTWKNEDGTVLETDTNVEYGTKPTYGGGTPIKAPTVDKTYTFAGWTTTIVEVTGDTEYIAKYTETTRTYTVTWKNEDGTVLVTDTNVEYGTKPTYDGETPVKASTVETTYTFAGWTTTIVEVIGDTEYIAKYTESPRKYIVTWKNADGTVLETDANVEYGTKPTYDGETPVKASTIETTYTFAGWTTTIVEVTGDAEYIAKYTETRRLYTITWKNSDGTVLETDTNVEYGTMHKYDGETPSKASTAETTYTFAGWKITMDVVTGNIEYVAKYKETTRTYTVTWKNEDGTVLERDLNVEYGTKPTYDGETPVKASTIETTYTFAGWTTTIVEVTGDTEYVAKYTESTSIYTVIWKNFDGTVLEKDLNVEYGTMHKYDGETPVKSSTSEERFIFKGWNQNIDIIQQEVEYIANFETINNCFIFTYSEERNAYSLNTIWKSGLTSLVIPTVYNDGEHGLASVDTIEANSFDDFDINTINIPSNIKTIEKNVFFGCSRLSEITVDSGNEQYMSLDGVLFNKDITNLICYPSASRRETYTVNSSVIKIEDKAFYNSRLTSINIPNSVKEIGSYAFSGSWTLTSVNFSEGLVSIGDFCFSNCLKLTSINIPNSVKEIGSYAFSGSWTLTSMNFSEGLVSIGDFCFSNCLKLSTITLPSTVSSIGNNAFVFCEKLENINISEDNLVYSSVDGVLFNKDKNELLVYPKGKNNAEYSVLPSVNKINENAFQRNSHLTKLIISSSVEFIDISSITGCLKLSEIIVDPSNEYFTSLDGVLFNKEKTKIITYPRGKVDTKYSIPETVTSIQGHEFAYNTTLTKINISASVKTIAPYSFAGCANLQSIGVDYNNLNYTSFDGVLHTIDGHELIAYPEGKTDETYELSAGVKVIGEGAFMNNSYLASIALGVFFKEIKDEAFYNCSKLTTVILHSTSDTIPSTLTTIGKAAFGFCTSLQSITIPYSVIYIYEYAFITGNNNMQIYCEASSKPLTWDEKWNANNYTVTWGYKL